MKLRWPASVFHIQICYLRNYSSSFDVIHYTGLQEAQRVVGRIQVSPALSCALLGSLPRPFSVTSDVLGRAPEAFMVSHFCQLSGFRGSDVIRACLWSACRLLRMINLLTLAGNEHPIDADCSGSGICLLCSLLHSMRGWSSAILHVAGIVMYIGFPLWEELK